MSIDEHLRYKELHHLILELATGNFAQRFQPRGHKDEIEKVGLMLNLLAEELSGFFIHSGSFGEKNMADPYAFLLNSELEISGVNCRFTDLMKYQQSRLIGSSITEFMNNETAENLVRQLRINSSSKQTFTPIRLILNFISLLGNSIECWGYCHLLKTSNGINYFFRGLPIAQKNSVNTPNDETSNLTKIKNFKTLQLQSDVFQVRKVHQYIMENLHQSLPPLATIARQFNLNEFKLKKGFKEVFNTTIFKLHLEKRLEMSKITIENTPTSLKVVAKNYGFRNYSHFSKAFKSKYGKKPSYYKHMGNSK